MNSNNNYRSGSHARTTSSSASRSSSTRSGSRSSSTSRSRSRRRKKTTGRFYIVIAVAAVVLFFLIFGIVKLAGGGKTTHVVTASTETVTSADPVSTDETASDSSVKTIDELIESDDDLAPLSGDDKVQTAADLSVNTELPDTWHNFLLLGSDSRNLKKVARTDTIMIASVNEKDGRIKLISIMRDMMVEIPGHGTKKFNACAYYGGPELVMQVINEQLNMNITEYALVNFYGFQKVIDAIGGIEMDITQEEMEEINSEGLGECAKMSGMDQADWDRDLYELKSYGANTHLTGMQALSYARIRHIDSDYRRTQRQREVLNAVLQKVKSSNLTMQTLMTLGRDVFQYIDTNIEFTDAISLAYSVLSSGIGEIEQARMPCRDSYESGTKNGTYGIWVDYERNAEVLYEFIYTK